jgi:hypothetical protein
MRNGTEDSLIGGDEQGIGSPARAVRRLIGLVVCAAALVPASASAATLTVNDDASGTGPAGATCSAPNFSTISMAVIAANPFDTIAVCGGTYAETVNLTKRLVLLGPQAGVDAKTRSGADEAVIDPGAALVPSGVGFTVREGATIDGFTFKGATQTALDYSASSGNGHTEDIRNNVFDGDHIAISGFFGKDSTITRNRVVGPTAIGVEGTQSTESLEISQNQFEGVTAGDIVFDAPGPFDDTYINSNTHVSGSGDFVDLRNNDDTEISNNLILGAATAIYIGGSNNGTFVSQNVITGDAGSDAITVTLESGLHRNSGTRILNNSISGKLSAVTVTAGTGASTSDPVEVQFNRIVDNSSGVVNEAGSGGIVLGTNNWWGCNAGPGAAGCDTVSGDVRTSPNLVFRVIASPDTIATGDTSAITADVLTNSAGAQVTDQGGTFPGGQPVPFTTTLGSVSPDSTLLDASIARTTLSSKGADGTARVRASLDHQTVLAPVTIAGTDLPDQPTKGTVNCTGVFKGRIIRGTPGVDDITGTSDGERIRARGGNDRVDGEAGEDCFSAGRGADRINAVDGEVDRIRCGGKIDRVKVDPIDIVKTNCEKIKTLG